MAFKTYFDKENWKEETGTFNNEPSLTDQSFKFDADINSIIVRMGGAPRTPVGNPVYSLDNYDTADWTFEDWQNQKAMLERRFLHLSPEMREYFGNAQNFLKYCSNPDNYELQKDGMIAKEDIPVNIPEVVPSQGGDKELNKNTLN